MTRKTILRGALASAFMFASWVVISDCTDHNPVATHGSVKLDLRVSSSANISVINYLVSGNGLVPPLTGAIDVSKSMTAAATVRNVPAGKKYLVQLDGESGDVTCAGSVEVDVLPGKTSQATIVLQCSDSRSTGTLSISGTFDNCPAVTSFAAMPMSAPVKTTIDLQATGLDLDGDGLTFRWRDSAGIGTLGTVAATGSRSAKSTFTCDSVGQTSLTVIASDGTCDDKASVSISCTEAAPAGSGSGGTGPVGGSGSGNVPGGGSGTGNVSGGGDAPGTGTGGTMMPGAGTGNMPGATGTGLTMGLGGMVGSMGTGGMQSSIGGTGYGGNGSCLPSHCPGTDCDTCAFGGASPNCTAATDGCDGLTDANDRKLCEDLIACARANQPVCLKEGNQGDIIPCWCGTNLTTCVSANSGPTKANGPCLAQIIAAARMTADTYDAPTIKAHFVDPTLPLGRAANLLSCEGNFCNQECSIP